MLQAAEEPLFSVTNTRAMRRLDHSLRALPGGNVTDSPGVNPMQGKSHMDQTE